MFRDPPATGTWTDDWTPAELAEFVPLGVILDEIKARKLEADSVAEQRRKRLADLVRIGRPMDEQRRQP